MKSVLVTILLSFVLLSSRLAAGQAAPGSLDDQLIRAAENGDTNGVQQLLQRGANIEAKGTLYPYEGATALIIASDKGETDVVKLLLDKGANIEARSKWGWTPLASAVSTGHADVVRLLLEKGANMEAREGDDWTALRGAIGRDNADMVKLLLDKGANIEAKGGSFGDTPLIYAADMGRTNIVRLLLEKGANIEGRNQYHNLTALIQAAWSGRVEVVKLLLDKGANIEARDEFGRTPLLSAAENGKTEAAALLIERGADITAKDGQQQTPAMVAEHRNHPELAAMLRKVGESPGRQDVEALAQSTVLTEKLGRYLPDLQKGVSIDALLDRAIRAGDSDVAAYLIDKGATVNALKENSTVLMTAVLYGNAEVVKVLLDKGANIEAKDSYGRTALIQAVSSGKADAAKLLLDRGANIEAKATASPWEGETALIMASDEGRTDMMKLLLDRGANIEIEEKDGDTALIKAAWNGQVDSVRLLLEKGANIEAKNTSGETALIVAAQGGITPSIAEGKIGVVKLLLDKGANLEAKDNHGDTALAWAKMSKSRDENTVRLSPGEPLFKQILSSETEVLNLLEQAVSKNPQDNLAEYVNNLQQNSYDDATREKAIRLAATLPALPAIPEEARSLFLQASALMKRSSDPGDLGQPIELLRKALTIAPWWANAYYNLSRALELSGQYDDAVKQLNYYLELKPSEADATEARAHIGVIQAEKEAAARKQQENENLMAVKYVSGGVTRLRYEDAPKWWYPGIRNGVGELYVYELPEKEDPFYVNAFRMSNGRIIAIMLVAQSNNGMYAGDRIGVFDITNESCIQGRDDFDFGSQDYTEPCGFRYGVSVSSQPNATVTVTDAATRASVTVPVALLYRGRAFKGRAIFGGCGDGTVYQGGSQLMVLHFDCSLVEAAKDPTVNAMGLTPTTVAPYQVKK
jgi:ankyrin repeat protein